jgi:O-antigen ligase
MLSESWVCGIGAGEMNFRSVYINFATAGIEDVPHSHSLYLQILIQVGVVGLIFLVGALLLCAQKVYSHRFDDLADKETGLIAVACFAGVVAILVFGLFDYVWYNYRIFLLFWMIVGLGAAHVFAAKDTEEEMDHLYF